MSSWRATDERESFSFYFILEKFPSSKKLRDYPSIHFYGENEGRKVIEKVESIEKVSACLLACLRA
jgi:hypothetical protein